MTNFLIAHSIFLALLLIIQQRRNTRRLNRLSEALRSDDRTLVGEHERLSTPSAFRELEKQIFEQLFEAENLEKRVGRRETLVEAVVNGLSDAVLVFDGDLSVRFANSSASELFGWLQPPIRQSRQRLPDQSRATRLAGPGGGRRKSCHRRNIPSEQLPGRRWKRTRTGGRRRATDL